MIILIAGTSHTGKTVLAQKILEKYQFPYLSIDHLKMGLIRSGYTSLTAEDDEKLTEYLWPVVREMIKTAIENHQNLTIEGCYIPFDWEKDFDEAYRKEIRYVCLIMTRQYIEQHFADILKYAGQIENRGDDSGCSVEWLAQDNEYNLEMCRENGVPYILIEDEYCVDFEL